MLLRADPPASGRAHRLTTSSDPLWAYADDTTSCGPADHAGPHACFCWENDVTTPIAVPGHYDPGEILAEVLDDHLLADDLAVYLTCIEVNVLAGFLDATSRHNGAEYWLECHRSSCPTPHVH